MITSMEPDFRSSRSGYDMTPRLLYSRHAQAAQRLAFPIIGQEDSTLRPALLAY